MEFQVTPLRSSMKVMHFVILFAFLSSLTNCIGQIKTDSKQSKVKTNNEKLVGGGCEGCELMYVGMPKNIKSIDTSAGWIEIGQKLLITGTIYKLGGKTPAPNVVVYYWQTDNNGYYSPKDGMDERAIKHGHIRGWIKSDENGNYSIYTIRPAPYPNEGIPAHIHLSIKEPNIENEYYADLYFDDDPLYLKHKKKYGKLDRAGTEILRVLLDRKIQVSEHILVLGLNIPNYPTQNNAINQSGLNIGEDQPSFGPYHAFGPDKGTQTCPVCKYGRYHGIVYFVGNHPNWENIKNWLSFLELQSKNRSAYLKVYFVYGNEKKYSKEKREQELDELGKQLNLQNVALTFVPSFSDKKTEANLNKINPDVENTFVIYKHRTIIDKFVNIKPTKENFNLISKTLDKTKNEYFNLPEPKHD